MSVTVAFVVEAVEFERGWGQRPDGLVCFETEDKADDFIQEKTAGREGPAPDVYVNYYKVGFKPCSDKNLSKIKEHGKVWVNNTKELNS